MDIKVKCVSSTSKPVWLYTKSKGVFSLEWLTNIVMPMPTDEELLKAPLTELGELHYVK